MIFTNALALLLILLLLPVAWIGRPSQGISRQRELTSLILRLTMLSCLILALAGLQIRRKNDNLAVVFLMDVSDSMSNESKSLAFDYVREAIQGMAADDKAALVTFGNNAFVDRSLSDSKELQAIHSVLATNQTNIAKAIRLAMAIFPNDSARRMVILSDGMETSGDAQSATKDAADSGIDILILPFSNTVQNEVLISDIRAPDNLSENERFLMNVTIEASAPSESTIRILANGQIVYDQAHTLNRGTQTLSIPLVAGSPGFTNYLIQLEAVNDTYYQNNLQYAYAQIFGPPTVLLVVPDEEELLNDHTETRPDESSYLLHSLEAAGMHVKKIAPADFPSELPILVEYQGVVLIDVPARQMTDQQMTSLQSYVRDLGGGLVTIGGPTSFGVGGYYRTPLEETLPVEMQIKDEQRRPSLAIVFIIDQSGSMSDTSGGVSKVELAKEAAIRSIDLLAPSDRVGVVAFDNTASWVVELTDLANTQEIINAIGSIRSGGGTNILAGLQAMARVLPDDAAKVKHVILLTDGGADPTGIPELIQKLNSENGITLSTVAVGSDAAPYLPSLAEMGGGRYHYTAEPATIPSIFTEETTLASRAYILEETFTPQLVTSSPILAGIGQIPSLDGYVCTSPKDSAQTILVSHLGDPVLAAWQYGLGRSVAFTSDATSRWAKDWVSWQDFPRFWSQAVGYVLSQQSPSQLEIIVDQIDEQAKITVYAHKQKDISIPELNNGFLNGYNIDANIIRPDNQPQTISLQQTAPGEYTGVFTPQQQGVYLIRVVAVPPSTSISDINPEPLSATNGWVLSYSPEYRTIASDPDALYQIVAASGGRLAPQNPADIFEHNLVSPPRILPVWTILIYTALFILPVDIAIRRLVITRADLAKFLDKINLLRIRSEKPPSPSRSTQIEGLFKAKERTNFRQEIAQEDHDKLKKSPAPQLVDTIHDTPSEATATSELNDQHAPETTASHLLAHLRSQRSMESKNKDLDNLD